MKPNIYTVDGEITNQKFAHAFAAGMGNTPVHKTFIPGMPWAGFGSPQNWADLVATRSAGLDFYFGDHAYFGRGVYYRITKNAFQHRGIGTWDMDRLKPFYEAAKPWVKGSHIILCPQSDAYHARMGWQRDEWVESVQRKLKLVTDRKIIIRTKKTDRPLAQDLKNAWCLITHASNSALESIMAGVPAICTGDSAASIMAGTDPYNVEYPFYPEGRMEWAAVLAANQWTLDEIAQGKAWTKLNERL